MCKLKARKDKREDVTLMGACGVAIRPLTERPRAPRRHRFYFPWTDVLILLYFSEENDKRKKKRKKERDKNGPNRKGEDSFFLST